nr:MAG TPA: hypothetical protein [Caudoviricetes sp.]
MKERRRITQGCVTSVLGAAVAPGVLSICWLSVQEPIADFPLCRFSFLFP